MRPVAVLAAVAAVAAGGALPALAADVSAERLRELARQAQDDPVALEELRRVDSVDGRQVEVGRLLSDAEGNELEGRLRVLAEVDASRAAGTRSSAAAREQAREILAQRRFEERRATRPLREPLEWLRDRIRSLVEPLVSPLEPYLPGGRRTIWALLALGVVVLAAVLGSRLVRRRAAEAAGRPRVLGGRPLDPRLLERDADDAERRGELERALRLRFRAGLLRLQRAEAIPARDSITSGEVARRLRSPEFDRLAATFDEVVYGGRRAERADLDASRSAWPRVLETVDAA